MPSICVHIVDDSRGVALAARRAFKDFLSSDGDKNRGKGQDTLVEFEVRLFDGPEEWSHCIQGLGKNDAPQVCLLDVDMGGDSEAGFKLARLARTRLPNATIVMFSGFDDASTVLRFKAAGADGFISKKTPMEEVPLEVLQLHRLVQRRRNGIGAPPPYGDRYAGATLAVVARRIPQILGSAIRSVHVSGETGTGKEVVADLFEEALRSLPSPRPFLRINCGAISPSLLESELFGHAKGAFTGAVTSRRGLIESANGGWVFLDEVACLPLAAQVALLRVIENQDFNPVGESRPRKVDVRVLSACNEDLEQRVAQGTFRRDLWQRLREAEIRLPPLRERKEEIPELVSHLCRSFTGPGETPFTVTPAALELLCRHEWASGNVRELRNCLRAMTEEGESRILGPNHVPDSVFSALLAAEEAPPTFRATIESPLGDLDLAGLEERLFVEVVRFLHGRDPKMSLRVMETQLGVSRSVISRRLRRAVDRGLLHRSDLPDRFWKGIASDGANLTQHWPPVLETNERRGTKWTNGN
ncbi:MAG: sigma-54-dependent Fis family transcriptional regulator [Silvanigrellales bacterium]|nr:sigma-54-dependent Fis family transcriptional regulator [Silvanigrellales bacterium]